MDWPLPLPRLWTHGQGVSAQVSALKTQLPNLDLPQSPNKVGIPEGAEGDWAHLGVPLGRVRALPEAELNELVYAVWLYWILPSPNQLLLSHCLTGNRVISEVGRGGG